MTDLYHPKTVAVPEINRRRLVEDYFQIFPNIHWKGMTYRVVTRIYASDEFTWDGMSIPGLCQRFVGNPFSPKHELAGINHDWHFMIQVYPKPVIDLLMLRILELDGETKFKRNLLYGGVKYGGGPAWRHHSKLRLRRCKCMHIEDIIDAKLTSSCPIHRRLLPR